MMMEKEERLIAKSSKRHYFRSLVTLKELGFTLMIIFTLGISL